MLIKYRFIGVDLMFFLGGKNIFVVGVFEIEAEFRMLTFQIVFYITCYKTEKLNCPVAMFRTSCW